MQMPRLIVMTVILAVLGTMPSMARAQVDKGEARIAEEAFIYGFPMVMNYAVFYQYFVDKSDPSYKAPLNQIYNAAECVHVQGHGNRNTQQRHAVLVHRHGPEGRTICDLQSGDREVTILLRAAG